MSSNSTVSSKTMLYVATEQAAQPLFIKQDPMGSLEQAEEVRQLGGEDELPDEIIADGRQLELMRQQVMLATSAAFQAARSQLEAAGGSTADRSVRSLLFEEGRVGVHPMMRHVAAGDSYIG
eukprot:207954-Pelagomonas_calceolata.AAC.3